MTVPNEKRGARLVTLFLIRQMTAPSATAFELNTNSQ